MSKKSLWNLIKNDFFTPSKKDPAFNSIGELFFCYPGMWALIHYRIAHALYQNGWKRFARAISGLSQIITHVDIHPAASIGKNVFFDHATGIVIGETAVVEDDVLIYQGVTLGGVALDKGIKRHPTVKQGAVIGSGAKILGNITIGKNCRIGSNSVVIKDVPDDSTAVGIPARVIQKGQDKNPLAHNKLPDINKELFVYMLKRICNLENAIKNNSMKDLEECDVELEKLYESFIKTIKD